MNRPASVDLSSDATNWFSVLTLQLDANGCAAFTLSGEYTGYYVRASVDWYFNSPEGSPLQHWFGTTGYYYPPGTQGEWMLNNYVYCASIEYTTPCR
jgi:hypothetical protein